MYEETYMPIPVWVSVTYTINLRTEYQQQMNELLAPLMTTTGGINYFIARKDGHAYECFIQSDFAQENNVNSMGEDRRVFITSITVKVLGYITGADKNAKTPKISIRENAVEVKIPREHVILGDTLPWISGKYRS